MDGPGPRQSRRTRSQRDRERLRRRAESQRRASSASSDSERPAAAEDGTGATVRLDCGAESLCGRRRPPRRRKRESASREEDIIDGFAIASFVSLEALETDCPLKTPAHVAFLRCRGTKRRRNHGDSEGHLDRESDQHGYPTGYQERRRKRGRKPETVGSFLLETGYICDAESDSGDKMSENDMDPIFIVSTRKEPAPLMMATSVRSGPSPPSMLRCHPWLSVTPRVSGLQRSQEKSVDLSASEPLATAAASLFLPKGVPTRHGAGPSPKLKDFLMLPEHRAAPSGLDFSSRSSTVAKPPSSSASSSSVCPPTPTASVAASLSGALPSRSHSSSGTHYRSSPGLPPLPPLQQGVSQPPTGSSAGAFTGPNLLSQELRSHFLTSKCTGAEAGAPTADTQTNGGPSSSGPSEASGRRSAPTSAQAAVPPLAFQFHQHNHQHQHTHTHQHFTPFLPPPTTAGPLFDKCKMEGLYRHPFFPQYPPTVPGIPPVLPSTGPFSSLQGAFQPKGTSPEMSPRLGPVAHLQPKDPKLSDPFKMSSRVSNKPGKWCAMHVRVAWMIFRHQEKVKADPRKLDFRSDMLSRLPGSGHGPLGAVHPSSSSFVPPLTPHSSFLTPPGHFDAFGRLLPYASLGSLGTGAFGGLGSTALVPSSFGPKDSPGRSVGGIAGCHDSWKRLHRTSAFSTAPTWTPAADKREEREPAKEKEVIHIKDEKDRDCLAYGRRPGLESPAMAPVRPRGSTPVSQRDREGPQPDTEAPPREGPPTAHSRDRERDSKPTPSLSSRSHLVPERPCSSSSSAPPTPAPSLSLASSPLDLYPCRHTPQGTKSQAEASRPPQKESFPLCAPTSLLSQDKKADPRPSQNRPSPHLLAPIKVKEERRDEPEPSGLSLLPPHPGGPAPLCLGPAPGLPTHHSLSLSLTPRAAGMVMGSPAERYTSYPHVLPQSHSWDPWREQQREALALRPDATLARLFQQHQAQRFYEAERVTNPHHPPGSSPLPPPTSARQDFGLPHHAHPEHGPQSMGGTGGGLLDTEQRAHILREDFERARYGMHPHTLLATPHLATPPHHHLEPLYGSLLSHPHQPGATGPHHHTSLYSRLGHLASHPRHVANGLISKATSGLMGSLSIGAPPPLIPSVTPSRASVSPRSSRFAPPPELVLYSTHKDRESR
ncbi:autism susceptibility gene 2 protein homolog isoform X1 [Brienomyrus brachyistius]|uniref:autism susceptibility gene 2 protein homolog isoform X1 n=1 Tax=Brienomyrus brachyistius TaxID=42636 RepID=UPI0020B18C2A|nr:autism susceptibility gene 2 protein homolog isoform X1 [Brienomyrus brachyistius]